MKFSRKYLINIIILVIIIFFAYLLFFWNPYPEIPPRLEVTRNKACLDLAKTNCNVSTYTILISDFDANKDGKIDSKDTLFELCKNYYGLDTDYDCKNTGCVC